MPAHFNRGATYAEAPQLPDDPRIDLLAQTNAKVEHFDLSPGGKSIAYVSAESGGYDLWVCDVDGSNNRRVVAMFPEECLNPSWSPDGHWIAYTARGDAFKVRVDGYGKTASTWPVVLGSTSPIESGNRIIGPRGHGGNLWQ